MSAGLLVWVGALGFFGFNLALVVWISVRLTVGAFWALLAFNGLLGCIVWGLFQLIP